MLLVTDAFSTKPLWHATWFVGSGQQRFVAASYESALTELGAPVIARRMAEPNEILVLRIGSGGDVEHESKRPLVTWDLHQYKNSTDDWIKAFRRAVWLRSRKLKHRAFIGLSSGYDSGAIALALKLQGQSFLAYTIKGSEDLAVVRKRLEMCADVAQFEILTVQAADVDKQRAWLEKSCEKYTYHTGKALLSDDAAVGVSLILSSVRRRGGLVYLSGSGVDEIVSDYARRGKLVWPGRPGDGHSHSCFAGRFPTNLSSIFPWCSFYKGSMRDHLMKEELIGGTHGVETRYPFLDVDVVQEFLWLRPEVKNSKTYKRPLADFLSAHSFPNTWDTKAGFGVVSASTSALELRFGNCGATSEGDAGDCERGERGTWGALHNIDACARRCARCTRCRYISFSRPSAYGDCSWCAAREALHAQHSSLPRPNTLG